MQVKIKSKFTDGHVINTQARSWWCAYMKIVKLKRLFV